MDAHDPPDIRASTAPAISPEDVLPQHIARALRSRYLSPVRHYHSFDHAEQVARLAADLGGDRACVVAAWCHDVVYDPARTDNESASADWLAIHLPDDPDLAEALRLIRLTATHDPSPEDHQGMILCDADLSILGAPSDDYAAYVQAVRREYDHLPQDQWATGRGHVLRRLVARPRLFNTDTAFERWESQARINVADELHGLTRPS